MTGNGGKYKTGIGSYNKEEYGIMSKKIAPVFMLFLTAASAPGGVHLGRGE
jgi:hypothetical protein